MINQRTRVNFRSLEYGVARYGDADENIVPTYHFYPTNHDVHSLVGQYCAVTFLAAILDRIGSYLSTLLYVTSASIMNCIYSPVDSANCVKAKAERRPVSSL